MERSNCTGDMCGQCLGVLSMMLVATACACWCRPAPQSKHVCRGPKFLLLFKVRHCMRVAGPLARRVSCAQL